MGKRETASRNKNTAKSTGNKVIINYPQPAPPIEHVQVFDILQSKDAEIKKLQEVVNVLMDRIGMQTEELERLRGHISKKDAYINSLLFRRA
jgi:uncharacterized small protein (DUF1192 family)